MITPAELLISVAYSTAAGIALGAEYWALAVGLVALQAAFVTLTLTT
jgi:hypothetical protein